MTNIDLFMQLYGKASEVKCRNGKILYQIQWIENNIESMVLEQKINNKWYFLNLTTDKEEIYKRIAKELVAKKINCCTYIKSIKRSQLYTGYQRIYITFSNNVRATYTIEDN